MKNIKENLEKHMTLNVLLTNKCNLNCIHCCNNSSCQNADGISTEKVLDLIEDASKYKVRGFYLTGGEVTLRDDLLEIIDAAHEKELEVGFFTNGILVKEELARKISGKVTYVCVSLDGPEQYHDYFRNQGGAYNKAISAIKVLVSHNINTAIQFTVTRSNLKYVDWVIELANELKVNQLYFAPLQGFGRATNIPEELLTPSDHRMLHSKIVEYRGKYLNLPIFYKGMIDADFVKKHPCNIFACSGRNCHKSKIQFPDKINIASDGTVYPLSSEIDSKFIMGNINDRNFAEIIDDYSESNQLKELIELCNYIYFTFVKNYSFFVLPWFDILADESKKNNYLNFDKVLEREIEIDPHARQYGHSHDHHHHGHNHDHYHHDHDHDHDHKHDEQNSSYRNDMQF
ncbi:radical SAM protein [Tissierella sp.]|uniref:radical SAM protein n=1 Tax=Tissierella sp. TaxID=41274 RepID=UPI003069C611